MQEVFTYEYIPLRGLSKRTLEFYDIKTKIDKDGRPVSVGFKYPNGAYKVRPLDKKEFYWDGVQSGQVSAGTAGLFGRDKFSSGIHKYVTITEGEFDAPSLWQVLNSPVVSVQSSSSASRDVAVDRSWLNSFERVYLAFDNDAPGREAVRQVARLFDPNKVRVLDFGKRKDANEYLEAGQADALRQIWWNAKRYLPEQIIPINKSSISEILSESPRMGVPYPFPMLNRMTYGIRRGESVLLTAQEGVGKTQLMHAIEHQLLKETDDAVGAIFLEEPKGSHLRALAGIELQRPAHLPDSGVTEAEVVEGVGKIIRLDDRLHLYSHFGSDDPDVLLDTIRFMVTACDVVYVLLDHITMVVSGLAGEDERRALDYIATRLEMMVKELNFSLIFVSHVNDMGQTRGSRLISKICDVRIDITRDLLAVDNAVRNTINMVLSKNRPIGMTGPVGGLLFDPYTRQYTERASDTEKAAANGNRRDQGFPLRLSA